MNRDTPAPMLPAQALPTPPLPRLKMAAPMLLALALTACSSGGTPASKAMPTGSANSMDQMPRADGQMFDVHAVPLYPGSRMSDMKIMAHTTTDATAFSFASPAEVAVVRAWFRQALPKAGYKVVERGQGFAGTDKAGKMFMLELAPAAGGTTQGTITSGN